MRWMHASVLLTVAAMGSLQGCTAVVVGGAAATAVVVAQDRRTTGTMVDDQSIELKAATVMAEDPELNRIYFAGLADPTALDPAERARFDMALGAYITYAQQAYYLAGEGALSDDLWKTHQATLRWVVKQPGFLDWRERWLLEGETGFNRLLLDLSEQSEHGV